MAKVARSIRSIRTLRTMAALGWLGACGLTNPIARGPDGTPSTVRVRAGLAAAHLVGDCEAGDRCSVQLSVRKLDGGSHHAEVLAVRLFDGDLALGPIPTGDVGHWRHHAYRPWNGRLAPRSTTKLSIDVGPLRWDRLLAPTGGDPRPTEHELWVEVDLAIDGEPVVVRSVFAVRPQPARMMMVT